MSIKTKELQGQSCPINENSINETCVRLIAAQVVILIVSAYLLNNTLLIAILFFDFGIRAFVNSKYSLLRLNALEIIKFLQLPSKFTNEAPKLFAAKIGAVVVGSIFIFYFLEIDFLIQLFSLAIVCFALLESVFSICVGCMIYQKVQRIKSA